MSAPGFAARISASVTSPSMSAAAGRMETAAMSSASATRHANFECRLNIISQEEI